jgi:2-polyprenyl-3-methyl-5-hydroxy-6-metoxy-1,4-benzoquinol methylase
MSVYSGYQVDFNNPNSTWAIAASMVENESTVLDVGCSAGQLAERLQQFKGCVVDGVERNSQDAVAARSRCRRLYEVDASDLRGTLEAQYDHILLLDVLEHLVDPVQVLRLLRSGLKPGGTFIVSTPNMAHISVRLSLLQGRFCYEDDGLLDRTHLHFFDRVALETTLLGAGLSARRSSCVYHDLPDQVIKTALARVGLAASQEFLVAANSPDSAAYQYVVEAVVGSGGSETPGYSDYVAPLHQYRHLLNDAWERANTVPVDLPPRWMLLLWRLWVRLTHREL